jgi:putative spermidine/putrescine transport system ATP-binding protein
MKQHIEVKDLKKGFGGEKILKGINMNIPQGEFLSILGPSGAGKTTLIKILAGIIKADEGLVKFPAPMKQRPVLVFQDYQLFPYMTVYNNIAFGLQARRKSGKDIEKQVRNMAGKLGIIDRLEAYPGQLSGGEKQRCALARALVLNPEVLLLDEPFANLDKNLKSETALLLRTIQQDFNLTIISVTHDQEEAMMLSDTIALLIGGELKEFGVAEQLYRRPRTLEGARFLGQLNPIPRDFYNYFHLKEETQIYCRPDDLEIIRNTEGSALVEQRFFSGRFYRYVIRLGKFIMEINSGEESIKVGDKVDLLLKESLLFSE